MGDSDEAKVDDSEVKPTESTARLNGGTKEYPFQLSEASQALVDASMALLACKSSVEPSMRLGSPGPLFKSRSSSPDALAYSSSSSNVHKRPPLSAPRFPRIDFDDKVMSDIEDKQPAWKAWQESVKDSYHKAKRTVERNKDESDFLESTFMRPRVKRGESPFSELETGSSSFVSSSRYRPSASSIMTDAFLRPSASSSNIFTDAVPYAAPAVSSTQGLESRYYREKREPTTYEKMYEKRIADMESRLIKSSVLPNIRSITAKEFRSAPNPAAGSATDQNDNDDYDFSMYTPRTYYSRPNRDDPDYFDYDLQHSVDLYKSPEGKYVARGSKPQEWETKLLGEARTKGSAPISGYMFTKGDQDWRQNNSSYLSAALRTPKFWEQRFTAIGNQVRDSNPISLESINRRRRELSIDRCERQFPPSARTCSMPEMGLLNKPTTSRFTEYRDPDFEDYDDPRADD